MRTIRRIHGAPHQQHRREGGELREGLLGDSTVPLFQLGDRCAYAEPGREMEVPVLVERAERGGPLQTDEEHVWLPPLEHWCAGIAHQVRSAASRDVPVWQLGKQALRAIADACERYPTASAAEVARGSTPPAPEPRSLRSAERCRAWRPPTGGVKSGPRTRPHRRVAVRHATTQTASRWFRSRAAVSRVGRACWSGRRRGPRRGSRRGSARWSSGGSNLPCD